MVCLRNMCMATLNKGDNDSHNNNNNNWYECLSLQVSLQASHCSTFRIMCDVPSTAVFCSESIECFHGTPSKFFLKLLVTIPVAPIIIGIIVHFRFHIRCISIHKLLYFNSCIWIPLFFEGRNAETISGPLSSGQNWLFICYLLHFTRDNCQYSEH